MIVNISYYSRHALLKLMGSFMGIHSDVSGSFGRDRVASPLYLLTGLKGG